MNQRENFAMENRIVFGSYALFLTALLCNPTLSRAAAGYLPAPGAVEAALNAAPSVSAAIARQDSANARAVGIRAGTAEFVVRATGQNRNVTNPSANFAEGQVAIERPLRLWGKADADAAIADAAIDAGALAAADARHQASRQMLALWFNVIRAREATEATNRNVELAAELVSSTRKRARAQDASRMDLEIIEAELARAEAAAAGARSAQSAAEADLHARYPLLGMPGGLPVETALPASTLLGDDARARYIGSSYAVRLALSEEAMAQRVAHRTDLERKPDPTVGAFVTVERGGTERIAGISISMPLGSSYRRASAVAAAADAGSAAQRRYGAEQAAGADYDVLAKSFSGLNAAAKAQFSALQLDLSAAARSQKAYAAGEIGVAQLLVVRRSLAETTLAARTAVVSALEAEEKLKLELQLDSVFR